MVRIFTVTYQAGNGFHVSEGAEPYSRKLCGTEGVWYRYRQNAILKKHWTEFAQTALRHAQEIGVSPSALRWQTDSFGSSPRMTERKREIQRRSKMLPGFNSDLTERYD